MIDLEIEMYEELGEHPPFVKLVPDTLKFGDKRIKCYKPEGQKE